MNLPFRSKRKIKGNNNENMETLQSIEQIIFDLNEENINESVGLIMNIFSKEYSYSFNLAICRFLYSYFVSKDNYKLCFDFLKIVQTKEREIMGNTCKSIIDIFIDHLLIYKETQESSYILEKMVENEMICTDKLRYKKLPYFVYINDENDLYKTDFSDFISEHYDELSNNDWELHKKLIKEGINPGELAKIIRNDEIERLQEISSRENFDFNQTIEPSLYERCSFINNKNITLIDYAAFFGAVKCFRYFLLNECKTTNTGKYAAAGGNLEVIHLCEQNHLKFGDACKALIMLHRNDVFNYLYENKLIEIKFLVSLGKKCITNNNFEIFSFLESKGMEIDKSFMIKAIQTGNLFLLKYLLQKKPTKIYVYEILTFSGNDEVLNYLKSNRYIKFKYEKYGESALCKAAGKGYIDLVKVILEHIGLHIAHKKDIVEALFEAVQCGRLDVVKLIFEKKYIDVKTREPVFGKTIFLCAAQIGNADLVKYLLDNFHDEIDINYKDKYAETALIKAAVTKEGNVHVVKLLLEQENIDLNAVARHDMSALMLAAEKGNSRVVQLLLEQKKCDVNIKNIDGKTALSLAVKNGHYKVVKLLLDRKDLDVNAKDKDGRTALMFAIIGGYKDIVKLLIEQKGIDINAKDVDGRTAFMFASESGNLETVQFFLEQKGIDINAKDDHGETALMYASENGNLETVQLLLEQKGIDINAKDRGGNTALLLATKNGHKETVQLLLEQEEIDINACDNGKNSALISAAQNDYLEIIQMLLKKEGINTNIQNTLERNTALLYASQNGNTEIVKLLLKQNGIDVNIKNKLGWTAIMMASKNGYIEIVKLLLEKKGIDITVKGYDGNTALLLATKNGHTDIAQLLENQ